MKKTIFTCLFGNYDTLNPAPKFKDWDTILFTDTPPKDLKGWRVQLVPTETPKMESRRYKFLSHIHLPEYDLVCYQDANIILTEEPPSVPMWLRHPRRKKVSEEVQHVLKLRKADGKQIALQMAYFRKNRFPDNAGLFQNGFFVRSNRSEKMNKLMELTFDIYTQFPTRDQLALPFASWKLSTKPEGARNYYLNDNQIQYLPHSNEPKQTRVSVHHITPARSDKNFGKAVNEIIENLPENDWICLRDIDTVPPYHEEFIKQVEEIANNPKGYSLIGCMTNRLGLPWQLVPNMFKEKNMDAHRAKAKELSKLNTIKPLTGLQTVGGLMMLFSKDTWRKAGKFPEGAIEIKGKFVDYHFSKAVAKFGKLGIAEHIYLFHFYRWDAKDTRTEKGHLK